MCSVAQVERQQVPQHVLLGNRRIPPVCGSNGGIEADMGIGKPLRPGIVEVGQRARLELARGGRIPGDRTRTENCLRIPYDTLSNISRCAESHDDCRLLQLTQQIRMSATAR